MKRRLSGLLLLLMLTGCTAAPVTERGQTTEETELRKPCLEEAILIQEDGADDAPYLYSNGEMILEFDACMNFVARKGGCSSSGTYLWDGFTLVLQDESGVVSTGFLTPEGGLVLEGENGVFASIAGKPLLPPQIMGRWKLQEKGVEVILYEDGRLVFSDSGQIRLFRFRAEGDGYGVFSDEERISGFFILEDGSMEVEDMEGQRLRPVP